MLRLLINDEIDKQRQTMHCGIILLVKILYFNLQAATFCEAIRIKQLMSYKLLTILGIFSIEHEIFTGES